MIFDDIRWLNSFSVISRCFSLLNSYWSGDFSVIFVDFFGEFLVNFYWFWYSCDIRWFSVIFGDFLVIFRWIICDSRRFFSDIRLTVQWILVIYRWFFGDNRDCLVIFCDLTVICGEFSVKCGGIWLLCADFRWYSGDIRWFSAIFCD